MPRSAKRLAEGAGLRAARDHHEDALRVDVLGALHEGREVGIGDRHAHRADDVAAGRLEAGLERLLGVVARAVVGDHGVGLLHLGVLAAHLPKAVLQLRNGHRGARHVGRLGGDDRGRRVHDHHELLAGLRDVAGGHGVGRQHEAGQDVDLVAGDQFLRQALGDRRIDAADVLADDLDLLAGDRVAVLLHEQLDGIVLLRCSIGELAGIGLDQADLDGACACADTPKSAAAARPSTNVVNLRIVILPSLSGYCRHDS